jgi:hypothetical protein
MPETACRKIILQPAAEVSLINTSQIKPPLAFRQFYYLYYSSR